MFFLTRADSRLHTLGHVCCLSQLLRHEDLSSRPLRLTHHVLLASVHSRSRSAAPVSSEPWGDVAVHAQIHLTIPATSWRIRILSLLLLWKKPWFLYFSGPKHLFTNTDVIGMDLQCLKILCIVTHTAFVWIM